MSRMTLLMATACCAASAASSGCVRGVTYRMPMPDSLTLGTIRGEGSARVAAAAQPAVAASPATRPATEQPRSDRADQAPVYVAGK